MFVVAQLGAASQATRQAAERSCQRAKQAIQQIHHITHTVHQTTDTAHDIQYRAYQLTYRSAGLPAYIEPDGVERHLSPGEVNRCCAQANV